MPLGFLASHGRLQLGSHWRGSEHAYASSQDRFYVNYQASAFLDLACFFQVRQVSSIEGLAF